MKTFCEKLGAFCEKWKIFMGIILDPWNLIFILLTVYLYDISITKENASSVLSTVLITLVSGVLGARMYKQWVDFIEGGVLVARGKSAVRSLKLLLTSILLLDKRIDKYLVHKEVEAVEVTKIYLEEIKERCNLLAEETVSSIENWTDIVPEADVKTHIGIITDLKFEYEKTALEIDALRKELDETSNKSSEESKALKNKIKEKDKELSKVRKELQKKGTSFGLGIGPQSGSYASTSGISSNASFYGINTESFGVSDINLNSSPSRVSDGNIGEEAGIGTVGKMFGKQ